MDIDTIDKGSGTVIYYHRWDGSTGEHDSRELIGYCVESCVDVLLELITSHRIHSYGVSDVVQSFP